MNYDCRMEGRVLSWPENKKRSRTLPLGIGSGLLVLLMLVASLVQAADSTITVECSKPGKFDLVKKFDMCQTGWSPPDKWIRVGKGRSGPIKSKHVRFVGSLLHQKWGGKPFSDEIFQILNDEGAVPYICMDPNPMIKGQPAHAYPKDMEAWRKLVREATVQAKKYGTVYYEVWNEPNHHNFWEGTMEQMFEMYKILTEEVSKVQPDAKFVSPGITSAGIHKWVGPFLDYVEKHKLPLHTVAFHDFGRDYNLGDRWIMPHVRDVQREINKRPQFKAMNLEIHVGECAYFGDPKDGDPADLTEAAAVLPDTFRQLLIEPQLTLVQWAQLFDTGHPGHWGNLGVVDTETAKQKPLYNAFLMYAMMPVPGVHVNEQGTVKALASKNDTTVAAWMYNRSTAASATKLEIKDHSFGAGTKLYKYMFAIDSQHSSFHETPGSGNLELLEKEKLDAPDGTIVLNYDMPGPGLKLVILATEPLQYDKYVIDYKIKGLPAPRTMLQGVTLDRFKGYDKYLVPGRAVWSTLRTLKKKVSYGGSTGDEAQAIIDAVQAWIDNQLLRGTVLTDHRPAEALATLSTLIKTVKNLPEYNEVVTLITPLSSDLQVKNLAKLYQEYDALTAKDPKTAGLDRYFARLKAKLEKYISYDKLKPMLKEEAESLLRKL